MKRLQYYILCFIILFVISLIILIIFEKNKERFVIELESDLETINLGENKYFWQVNLESLKQQILSLKDIYKVDLRYLLPNKVKILTEKRKAIAVWWDYERFFLVDRDGVIISDNVSNEEKKQYILIVGTGAIDNLKTFMHSLVLSNYNGKVISARFVGMRRWDIVLSDGTVIKLPEKNQESTLSLLDKLLRSTGGLISKGDIVDMRLAPKKVFLKRQSNVEKQ